MDTDVKNVSGYGNTNPLVSDFYEGDRKADRNNFGPRLGFNWAGAGGRLGVHGGWGIYYDRIALEITSLERGLDGRALPIEVKAGNVFFLDPQTGQFPPFAPSLAEPVHRLRAARRGRVRHQHHRQRDAVAAGAALEPRRRGRASRATSSCASTASGTRGRTSSSAGRWGRSTTRSSAGRTGW